MKPELLSITNIGPFIGKHIIDFTVLDSIFLVCGKTGAGKTTVFDAISYVFYSKPQGSRSNIVRSLRSQFASYSETAEAELIFTIGGAKYKIMRRLPFLKPGNKTEKPEEVEFSEWKNGVWKDLTSTNKSETDKKILDIIKLNEKEFSRIVLLPQGQFAEFLKENSNQKKDTLSELFPVGQYTNIMKFVKDKEKEEAVKIKHIQNQLESLGREWDFNSYKAQKDKIEESITIIKKNYNKINNEIKEKASKLEQSRFLIQKQLECDNAQKLLKDAELRTEEIEVLKRKIEKAYRAAALSGQAESVKKLIAQKEDYTNTIEKELKEFNSVTASLKILEQEKDIIEEERLKNEILKQNLSMLTRSAVIYREIKKMQSKLDAVTFARKNTEAVFDSIKNNESAITKNIDSLKIQAETLGIKQEEKHNAEAALNYAKKLFDIVQTKNAACHLHTIHLKEAENKLIELEEYGKHIQIEEVLLYELKAEKAKVEMCKTVAVIADTLKENEPCPVCGSIYHPNPAFDEGKDIFSIDEKIKKSECAIKQFLEKKEECNTAYIEHKKDSEKYAENAKSAQTMFLRLNNEFQSFHCIVYEIPEEETIRDLITTYAKQAEDAAASFKKAYIANEQKSNAEYELAKTLSDKEITKEKVTDFIIKEKEIQAHLKEMQAQYDSVFAVLHTDIRQGNIEDAIDDCEKLILKTDIRIKNYKEQVSENKIKHTRLETVLTEKQRALEKTEQTLLQEEDALSIELKQKGFTSITELFSSIFSEEEVREIENEIKEFEEKKIALRQTVIGLQLELKNRIIENPGILEKDIFLLEKKIDEENTRLTELTSQLTQLNNFYDRHKQLVLELHTSAEHAELLTSLSNDLNGDNKCKLKFDIWILSAFLKEITIYANTRLERMSLGRYVLKVSDAVSGNGFSGLDLEIYDAYTGGMRPAASLSGGETFMVSISLALGLADSIQAQNGGIKLDSMFIDEGFGSLDEASLENAITILDEVRGNRMVGIISHVSELRSRIPQKIEIEKTSHGSYIKQS